MKSEINDMFSFDENSSEFLGMGKKSKAKREAKKDLKASGMSGKQARQALKNSPCGKKPANKSSIESWKQCLAKNGLSPSQVEEVVKAGDVDNVSDAQLDKALNIDLKGTSDDSTAPKSNTLLYIGLGIGSLAVLGFTAWLIFRKK